jgi:putative acetyltransferase
MSAVEFELIEADTHELVQLARMLFREYAAAIGTDLEYQGFSAELEALPRPYAPPAGALLIARSRADAAGCVGLRQLEPDIGELKRLYVRPPYRSAGLGKRLVEAVVNTARAAGYHELRLDTLQTMTPARALYRSLGFVEIAPYSDNYLPGTKFYSLSLSG